MGKDLNFEFYFNFQGENFLNLKMLFHRELIIKRETSLF